MSHKGVRHDPLADIQLIRDNLNDRYDRGFPIIKELLQNAEDAQATRLDLGIYDGVEDADHPLLKTPGMFVINDGLFTAEDAEAIGGFGLSYKGGNEHAIGKFGLGIKSLFHLCEAFFYLASPNGPEDARAAEIGYLRSDILNPWSSEDPKRRIYPAWDAFTEADRDRIKRRLSPLFSGANWFCLWIPLRHQSHGLKAKPIMNFFVEDHQPTESILFDPDTAERIAVAFPMLRYVTTCAGWQCDASGLRQVFHVSTPSSAARSVFGRHDFDTGDKLDRPLAGQVVFTKNGDAPVEPLRYWGQERLLEASVFHELRSSRYWPYAGSKLADSGISEQRPEKADPHCATTLAVQRTDSPGQLEANWAVFLPLGRQHRSAVNLPVGVRVSLTLHGYFFLDAGRARIDLDSGVSEGPLRDDIDVRKRWNSNLARQGPLALVIPVLKEFVAQEHPPEETVRAVTEAFRQMDLFRNYDKWICSKEQWLFRAGATGGSWSAVPVAEPFYEMPSPEEHCRELPGQLLGSVADTKVFTYRDYPRLTTKRASSWPEETLVSILQNPLPDRFLIQEDSLSYLADMLDSSGVSAVIKNDLPNKMLRQQVRRVIAKFGLERLRGAGDAFGRILAHILPAKSLFVRAESAKAIPDELLESLAGDPDVDLVVLPESFPGVSSLRSKPIETKDVSQILIAVSQIPTGSQDPTEFRLARMDIAVAAIRDSRSREEVVTACGDLKLFVATDLALSQDCLFSIHGLRRKAEWNQLFTGRMNLAASLQKALSGAAFVHFQVREPELILGVIKVGECTPTACCEVLTKVPPLAPAGHRCDLFKALVANVDQTRPKLALRYLLHGISAHWSDDKLLLAPPAQGQDDVVVKLVRQLVQLADEAWTFVPLVLANMLNETQMTAVGVARASLEAIQEHLKAPGIAERIDCEVFDLEERRGLIRQLGPGVLKRLRMHETLESAQLVSITNNCYWNVGFQLSSELLTRIILLRKDTDPVVALYQSRLAPDLDPRRAIELALSQEDPSRHWAVVLRGISELGPAIDADLATSLGAEHWIPVRNGSVLPAAVIHIRGLDEQIHRVLGPLAETGLYSLLALPAGFQESEAAVGKLLGAQVFPSRKVALRRLSQALASVAANPYAVGLSLANTTQLQEVITAFQDAPAGVMPIMPMATAIAGCLGLDTCLEFLAPDLCRAISDTARLKGILAHLAAKSQIDLERREALRDLHLQYLGGAVLSGVAKSILPDIELLNRRGKWKKTSELCAPAPGISPEHLLGDRQLEVLHGCVLAARVGVVAGDIAVGANDAAVDEELDTLLDRSVETLANYFRDWRGLVESPEIGGFLSVLGDWPDMAALADSYLAPRTRFGVRMAMGWQPLPHGVSGAGQDVNEAMAKVKFLVSVTTAKTCRVSNILGQEFDAPLAEQPEEIVLPIHISAEWVRRRRLVHVLQLRGVNPHELSEGSDLSAILCKSAATVLREVYYQKNPTLDDLWAKLAKSEQLGVRMAQALILGTGFFYLRQLRTQDDSRVRTLLSGLDRNHRQFEELHLTAARGTTDAALRKLHADRDVLKKELKDLICRDSAIQEELLAAVRGKMRDFQYTPQSLPFELFQNAEDAVSELQAFEQDEPASVCRRLFAVQVDEVGLCFAHWGRLINHAPVGATEEVREQYQRDLQKMLVMSSSDKYVASPELKIVGKFGLGFKSVFLVSEQPRLLSGRLGLRVLGGMFPQELAPEDVRPLEETLESLGGDSRTGTLVAMELDRKYTRISDPRKIVERFRQLVPYVLAFARQINTCRIRQSGNNDQDYSWLPERVVSIDRQSWLEGGTVLLPESGEEARLVVFRLPQGEIMFRIDQSGFRELPDNVPAIWSLAPTESLQPAGIAVNARFEMDVGRTLLAGESEGNRKLASELALHFGSSLAALYKALVEDPETTWTGLAGKTAGAKIDDYELWHSFWTVITCASRNAEGRAAPLFRQCLWGTQTSGIRNFFASCEAIPTGLSGQHRVLVNSDVVRSVCSGAVADSSVFSAVSSMSSFGREFPPGTVVSRQVAEALQSFMETDSLAPLTLAKVLEKELPETGCVEEEQAERIGQVITRDFLHAISKLDKEAQADLGNVQESLRNLKFRAEDGEWHPCEDLLVLYDEEARPQEERLRASFAPASRTLGAKYKGGALPFFLACRPEMKANAEQLLEWILAAEDEPRRKAALQYLDVGALAVSVQEKLTERGITDSWLGNMTPDSPILVDLSPCTKAVISGRLDRPDLTAPPKRQRKHAQDPRQILRDIAQWWAANQADLIGQYEHWIYPEHACRNLDADPEKVRGDASVRSSWMSLFVTGAMHTFGRVQMEQNRSFLEKCGRRGWLDVFSSPELRPDAWMGILYEFLDEAVQGIEYFYWMAKFVSIYQFAHWLPEYVNAFLSVNRLRPEDHFDLVMVTKPRASHIFQGATGFDAPPIARTLGIGGNFVLRELVRQGLVNREDKRLWRYCYVPIRRVRQLLASITGDPRLDDEVGPCPWERSTVIQEVLGQHMDEGIHFGYAFDIPFMVLSDSRYGDLRAKLLGGELSAQLDADSDGGPEEELT